MAQSKFIQLNTPFFEVAPDLGRFGDTGPLTLRRETNDWQGYFGKFPLFCARITTEEEIQEMLTRGYRHVAKIPINVTDTRTAQRETMERIESVVTQLDKFGVEWRKTAGKIQITRTEHPGFEPIYNEDVSFEFLACDDSGDLHILAVKPAMFMDGEIFDPDMNTDKLNQLIFCIRSLFTDRDPADELPILTRVLWETTIHLTLTPDFDCVEFHPEWMDDDFPDWFFPETEPFTEPVIF